MSPWIGAHLNEGSLSAAGAGWAWRRRVWAGRVGRRGLIATGPRPFSRAVLGWCARGGGLFELEEADGVVVGSVNQAASANPMPAMPSAVFSSGRSWMWTPRARRTATSVAMLSTRQQALVAWPVVPVVVLVTASRLVPPQPPVGQGPGGSSPPGRGYSQLRSSLVTRG